MSLPAGGPPTLGPASSSSLSVSSAQINSLEDLFRMLENGQQTDLVQEIQQIIREQFSDGTDEITKKWSSYSSFPKGLGLTRSEDALVLKARLNLASFLPGTLGFLFS